MINFGIDLGTTNSAIARFDSGKVYLYRNPIGQKDTIASVVAYKNQRILVGEKARELLGKQGEEVVGNFKRKMGTADSFFIPSLDKEISPVELSAQILKELKSFVHDVESPTAAVITIPASFDTLQANATKEAGYAAGFEQVELLQEPIAASLAYANQSPDAQVSEGKWLVYDLGGGTFDAALVELQAGEMKVIDHEGNNFLGGVDFDKLIVEKLMVPYLEQHGTFKYLDTELTKSQGKYPGLYAKLLYKAEEAKQQLSQRTVAELEFEAIDDQGKSYEAFQLIKRKQFEPLIMPQVAQTLDMIEKMLKRNQLKAKDLRFVLLVGGSTYIPYVREQLAERLRIPINAQIDPTTAVAVGAAYYAGTRPLQSESHASSAFDPTMPLQVKMAYQKNTQELEEYFTAKIEGLQEGYFYRIQRKDGGYDSGLVALTEKIQVDLPLVPEVHNLFNLTLYDADHQAVALNLPEIGITHGKYTVYGQPLPHDICLEIDDVENQRTALEVVFNKNAILPLRKTLVKQVSRTLRQGSEDELIINVLEGPGHALPAANQSIGFIRIAGEALNRDLIKGSDVEIGLKLSDSRDLSISVYLMMTGQEFQNTFTPAQRNVDPQRLTQELEHLAFNIKKEVFEAELQSNFNLAQELVDLEYELLDLLDKSRGLDADNLSDEKYQLEDQKRKLAQQVDGLTRDKLIDAVKQKYFQAKRNMEFVLENYQANEQDREQYQNMLNEEKDYLASDSNLVIQGMIDRINRLNAQVVWKSPVYLTEVFTDLSEGRYGAFVHKEQARALMHSGDQALVNKNWNQLRVCINGLWELLPPQERKNVDFSQGTGIN